MAREDKYLRLPYRKHSFFERDPGAQNLWANLRLLRDIQEVKTADAFVIFGLVQLRLGLTEVN